MIEDRRMTSLDNSTIEDKTMTDDDEVKHLILH